jgi:NAD-dependent DNA ligase
MSAQNVDKLIESLIEWDYAYFNGEAIVPDEQYDQTKRLAQSLAPDHKYFKQVGSDVRGGKIKLPYPMGSLDQIYEGDVTKWVARNSLQNSDIIITEKLDGVSCLLSYESGKFQIAYSRGDGIMGADITRHLSKMPNFPKVIKKKFMVIRGEVIMKKEIFNEKYAEEYKNPRNMVAGCMNRSVTGQSTLTDLDFIAYEMVDSDENLNKADSIEMLKGMGFQTPNTMVVKGNKLDDKFLAKTLSDMRNQSAYELDGIVLTIDDFRSVITSPDRMNPEHSVKYKVLDADSILETTVKDVIWNISKSGYLKPTIQIKPVELFGTTVTFATGFNAKFINDNKIGPGTRIKITKSGSVIPYVTEILEGTTAKMPTDHDWAWDENMVEIVVCDSDTNPDVIFLQVLDFFDKLNVDLLKEASLKKIFEDYNIGGMTFDDAVLTILDLTPIEWSRTLGVNGDKIYASLCRRLANAQLYVVLGATCHIGVGFGVRKAKALLKQIPYEDLILPENPKLVLSKEERSLIERISECDGFDTITAEKIVENIRDFDAFLNKVKSYFTFVEEKTTNEMVNINLVMTGFRDKELKEKIESMGGKVSDGVSKKTTHLLALDISGNSGKLKKARELGIAVMTADQFRNEFNL